VLPFCGFYIQWQKVCGSVTPIRAQKHIHAAKTEMNNLAADQVKPNISGIPIAFFIDFAPAAAKGEICLVFAS